MATGTLHPWKLRQAARCIHDGGLIAYPTEAVYGLGCDPLNGEAVQHLLAIKQRPAEKGLILIAADFGQLRPFVRPLPRAQMESVLKSWPGPHTWLLPAAAGLPWWLTGSHETIAVRVTAHPIAAALCRAARSPLVSTSANRSGQPPLRTSLAVRATFGGEIGCLVHGTVGNLRRPTPIRDARTGKQLR